MSVFRTFSKFQKSHHFLKSYFSNYEILSENLKSVLTVQNTVDIKRHELSNVSSSDYDKFSESEKTFIIKKYKKLFESVHEIDKMYTEVKKENDSAAISDCCDMLKDIEHELYELRLSHIQYIYGTIDECYIEIRAGAGGQDSYDWASILYKMITQWAKSEKKYKVILLDTSNPSGDVKGGIRQATIKIKGENSFTYFQAIAGTHRLVRVSPFDNQNKRHTSFAQILVYPQSTDLQSNTIEIKSTDLVIDTYKASGAGGQHVNTTDSAIRITHLPTGIVVSCQNERSQHMNRSTAMMMLKSKLYHYQQEQLKILKQESIIGLDSDGHTSWGTQIISVVMHPYQTVKDHRTNWSNARIQDYLCGNNLLSELIEIYLLQCESIEYKKLIQSYKPVIMTSS